jgi:transposase-like protein
MNTVHCPHCQKSFELLNRTSHKRDMTLEDSLRQTIREAHECGR